MIGTNIRMGMAKVGLNLNKFAFEMDVSRQTASAWVNDKATPSPKNVEKMCELFKTSKGKFYGWTE